MRIEDRIDEADRAFASGGALFIDQGDDRSEYGRREACAICLAAFLANVVQQLSTVR